MNIIEQIKQDRANGVMVSQETWDKLLAYSEEKVDQPALHGWHPIETAPTDRQMFVARAFNQKVGVGNYIYTSDAYCVWREGDGFVRWPHPYQPTHWMPLPAAPEVSA